MEPTVSRRERQFELLMSKAGVNRSKRQAMKINATLPADISRTVSKSIGDRMDRAEGLAAKNNHSMET